MNSLETCFGRFTRRCHLTNAYEDWIATHCYSWLCFLFSMFDVLWSRKIVFIAWVVNIFYGRCLPRRRRLRPNPQFIELLFEIYWLFHLRWHSLRCIFQFKGFFFCFFRERGTNDEFLFNCLHTLDWVVQSRDVCC